MRPNALALPRGRAFSLLLAAGALLTLLLLPGTASADLISPESGGSPNADRIDTLYKLVLLVAVVVFVGVVGALGYSLWKFRARKGAVAAQIHGNTRLEIGWTIGAAVILVVLAVITFASLDGIRNPENSDAAALASVPKETIAGPNDDNRLPSGGKSLNVCVNGQQYLWSYYYARNCKDIPLDAVFAYEEMVVPTDVTVTLDINAQDVAHSWWIPRLGGKFDAIPGYTNYTWFKVPGKLAGHVFTGQCAEMCGRNHANMTARVRALAPEDFKAWYEQQQRDIKAADDAEAQERRQAAEQAAQGGEEQADESGAPTEHPPAGAE